MADFAVWGTACGTALWPTGTFAHTYDANRKAAVQGVIETDPVAVCVRVLMAEPGSWAGTTSDLLRVVTYLPGDDISKKARTGQDIPAPSPAGCVACKLSFA